MMVYIIVWYTYIYIYVYTIHIMRVYVYVMCIYVHTLGSQLDWVFYTNQRKEAKVGRSHPVIVPH